MGNTLQLGPAEGERTSWNNTDKIYNI